MSCRWLWVSVPVVAGHAGCIAFPATAMALGLPAVLPVCGGGVGALLPALASMGLHLGVLLVAGLLWSTGCAARHSQGGTGACFVPHSPTPRSLAYDSSS